MCVLGILVSLVDQFRALKALNSNSKYISWDDNNNNGKDTDSNGVDVDVDDDDNDNGDDLDWFNSYRWWNQIRPYEDGNGIYPFEVCHYVEDVCRIEGISSWVYDPNKHKLSDPNKKKRSEQNDQGMGPIVTLHPSNASDHKFEQNHGDPSIGNPNLQESWNIGYLPPWYKYERQCSYLPVANHFVMNSLYSSMLGEFMARAFYQMAELVRFMVTPSLPCVSDFDPPEWHTNQSRVWVGKEDRKKRLSHREKRGDKFPAKRCLELAKHNSTSVRAMVEAVSSSVTPLMKRFRKQSQFYLTGVDGKKGKLRESVRALMSVLSDHEVFSSVSLSSLAAMQRTFPQSSGHGECTCVKRLFYCGMKEAKLEKEEEKVELEKKKKEKITDGVELLDIQNDVMVRGTYDPGAGKRFVGEQLDRRKRTIERLTRNFLLNRKSQMVKDGLSAASTTKSGKPFSLGDVPDEEFLNEWKIVGVCQRSDRRRWLNHADVMDACRDKFTNPTYKIMCIELDVGAEEFWDKPDLHIAAHAGLSAMIGIFGAQFGEVIFMPEGSFALELLPMIPHGYLGEWSRYVHRPTDIGRGALFKMDVHNIGFPLTMSSLMHIPELAEKRKECNATEMLKAYGRAKVDGFKFQSLDFEAPVEAISDFIERFVAVGSSTPGATKALDYCEDFVKAAGDDFVLYNIHCSSGYDKPKSPHHFYRRKEWIDEKTHEFMHQNCSEWDF